MLLMEFDKAGAEWVVVAYLCGDARMIDVVESGKRPHAVTGSLLSGASYELVNKEDKIIEKLTDPDGIAELREKIPEFKKPERFKIFPRTMSIYQMGKKSNHGLNYREGVPTFALTNEISERDARPIVEAYSTTVYPNISLWWDSIDEQLRKNRTFTNCFGRKVKLLGEWGKGLKNQATSFEPQSTISDMVVIGMTEAYADKTEPFRKMDLLTQTYDSVTLQYPTDNWNDMADFAIKFGMGYLSPKIERNGRKFKVKTDLKIGLDWGNMVEVEMIDNGKELAKKLQEAFKQLSPSRRQAA